MSTIISEPVISIIGLVLALALNALLVACELSLIKIRFSHFNPELRDRLSSMKRLERMLESGDRTIRVIRIGLSACLILYSLLVFPLLLEFFQRYEITFLGDITLISVVLAFLVALALHHFVGELLPRGFGLAYPIQTLRFGALVIGLLGFLTRPVRLAGIRTVRFLWKAIRKEELPDLDSLDLEAQIELLSNDSTEMSTVAQLILKNTLAMRDLVVSDVLLPRNQVKYFDMNVGLAENLEMAKDSGHTRFPLCFGDLDRCVGLIHIKDLFRYKGDLSKVDLRKLKRNILRIDSEEPLEAALTKLLAHKVHMALVIDEFRGTEGVLTLERILEELVGDIRDEFDAEEEERIKLSDDNEDEAIVSGLTPIHEIESRFEIDFDNDEVSTIGGLITSYLGRIPEIEECVELSGLKIEVTAVEETRVVELKITRTDPNETEEPANLAEHNEIH